jgi:hypothetical protein
VVNEHTICQKTTDKRTLTDIVDDRHGTALKLTRLPHRSILFLGTAHCIEKLTGA